MVDLNSYVSKKPTYKAFLKQVEKYDDLADQINKKDKHDADALYWALDGERPQIAQWLIDNGAEANTDGVYAAAQRGYFDIMKHLVDQGAPIDKHFSVGGFTPLIAAMAGIAIGVGGKPLIR